MVKIVAIGDPHGSLEKVKKIPVKDADLILLTGDLGSAEIARKHAFTNIERKKKGLPEKDFSKKERKKSYLEIFNSSKKIIDYLSKFAPVYLIFGNVEYHNREVREIEEDIGEDLPSFYDYAKSLKNVRVINNRIANFKGIRIGGLEWFVDTNWVKDFKPSNYKERLESAKKETKKAERVLKWFNKIDILVCHQPPYGYLDKVTAKFAPKNWKGKNAGSKSILKYIKDKRPKYVFCGHIHEGEGYTRIGISNVYNLGVAGYKSIEI